MTEEQRSPEHLEELPRRETVDTPDGDIAEVPTLASPPSTLEASPVPGAALPRLDADTLAREIQRNRLASKMFGVEARRAHLGRYELLDELGRGGMGVVYLARDPQLDRTVAIKQLSARDQTRHQRRFVREALAMAKLSHPNVIPIYEISERDDATFIVMEFVAGQTLRDWQSGERPRSELLAVYKAAARGLIAAHQKMLVHRDFKPDKVTNTRATRYRAIPYGTADDHANPLHASEFTS